MFLVVDLSDSPSHHPCLRIKHQFDFHQRVGQNNKNISLIGSNLLALNSVFCSMKLLEVHECIAAAPGWVRSPSQVSLPVSSQVALGGERQRESKVSCPRTQHSGPDQDLNPDCLISIQVCNPSDNHICQSDLTSNVY